MGSSPMGHADARFMRRCFEIASAGARQRELPFGSVIARGSEEISAESNGVRQARDITRHAEVRAMVSAQLRLGNAALEGCTLYTNVEPCVFCSFAIRETRIARVVYALGSPVMGGASRWDVLSDDGLARALPEAFGPAPEVVAGFLADEADALLRRTAPLMWATAHGRRLFVCDDMTRNSGSATRPHWLMRAMKAGAIARLRQRVFDRLSRGTE